MFTNIMDQVKRLYRSSTDHVFGGVCGGIAEYFHVDPVMIRIAAVFLALISCGAAIVAYLLMWIIVPQRGKKSESVEKKKK